MSDMSHMNRRIGCAIAFSSCGVAIAVDGSETHVCWGWVSLYQHTDFSSFLPVTSSMQTCYERLGCNCSTQYEIYLFADPLVMRAEWLISETRWIASIDGWHDSCTPPLYEIRLNVLLGPARRGLLFAHHHAGPTILFQGYLKGGVWKVCNKSNIRSLVESLAKWSVWIAFTNSQNPRILHISRPAREMVAQTMDRPLEVRRGRRLWSLGTESST